jgi:hypothetical protein
MSNTMQRVLGAILAVAMTAMVGWLTIGWPASYVPAPPDRAEPVAARRDGGQASEPAPSSMQAGVPVRSGEQTPRRPAGADIALAR